MYCNFFLLLYYSNGSILHKILAEEVKDQPDDL